jgi:Flp pilus assembly protein TadG
MHRFHMISCLRRRGYRTQSGQALVEFTLILAPLMLLVLAVLAFWPIFTARDAVAFAAASGAHEAAITGGDTARVERSVDAMLSTAAFDLSTRKVQVTCVDRCARYQPVTVSVAVHVKPWIRLPMMPESFTVSAEYTRASEVDGGPHGIQPIDGVPDLGNSNGWNAPGAPTVLPGGTQ